MDPLTDPTAEQQEAQMNPAQDQSTQVGLTSPNTLPGVPAGLDPTAYVLTRAIAMQEGGGSILSPDHPSADFPDAPAGTAGGMYQFTPDTWKVNAQEVLGNANAPMTDANQNQVAYTINKQRLDAGNSPAQVASMWNAGPGAPDAWKPGTVQAHGDTPQYVANVQKYAEQIWNSTATSGGGSNGNGPPLVPIDQAPAVQQDIAPTAPASGGGVNLGDLPGAAAAFGSGTLFPAAAGDSATTAGLKTAGNLIPSAFAFGKGVVDSMNPLKIIENIAQVPGAWEQALAAHGGDVQKTLEDFGTSLLPTTYQTLVPKFGQDLVTGNTQAAQADVENNPVGSIAPFIFGARGLAGAADAATEASAKANMADYVSNPDRLAAGEPIPRQTGTNFGGAIDSTISKVASPVTAAANAVGDVAGKVAGGAGNVARYAFGQATGLEPSTIKTIAENPNVDFSTVNRGSLGDTIKSGLDAREETLGETGSGYDPIKAISAPIKVDSGFLADAIKQATGLDFEEPKTTTLSSPPKVGEDGLPIIQAEEGAAPKTTGGTFTANATSAIDAPSDVAKIQRLYDAWQPKFDAGTMSTSDFLTLRSKLAGIAYNDLGIKNGTMASAAEDMRGSLNSSFRDQIDGLAKKEGAPTLSDTDADYSSQKTELKNLRKGILDKDGNLTDGAINKIANATGKGKDLLLGRLEEISPGITGKIKILKASEDLERASGNKVGTYARSTGTILGAGAGYAAGGPYAAVAGALAEMVLQNPDVATAIIKTYAKSSTLLGAVAQLVKKGGSAVNNLPSSMGAVPSTVFGRPQAALPTGQ